MIIIQAIDLKNGQCVRLRQGLMEDTAVFSDNPVEMAAQWVAQGARRLHLVDLNGAFEGKPVNAQKPIFAHLAIFLNLVLARLRLGLPSRTAGCRWKNRQVGF
jgi:phosphoribosylformimino-5-aminoimidazole carboxamide ribonucleotide (ProFAR) isomerase